MYGSIDEIMNLFIVNKWMKDTKREIKNAIFFHYVQFNTLNITHCNSQYQKLLPKDKYRTKRPYKNDIVTWQMSWS